MLEKATASLAHWGQSSAKEGSSGQLQPLWAEFARTQIQPSSPTVARAGRTQVHAASPQMLSHKESRFLQACDWPACCVHGTCPATHPATQLHTCYTALPHSHTCTTQPCYISACALYSAATQLHAFNTACPLLCLLLLSGAPEALREGTFCPTLVSNDKCSRLACSQLDTPDLSKVYAWTRS